MKKLLCLVLCLCLALPAAAMAETYTLPEKLMYQLDIGSGLKGSLMMEVSGSAPWARLLAPLSGIDVEVRAIKSGDAFQGQLYMLDGETQRGLTRLYADGSTMALRSELLPGTLLTMPIAGDMLNALLGLGEDQNPTLYSAALNIAMVSEENWEEYWTPVLEPYYAKMEMWLSAFGSAPSVKRDDNGGTTMLIRYEVPVSAVKEELLSLLRDALADEQLLTLLRTQMTQAQQEAYLNANLMYYYTAAVEALALDGSLVLERELTAKGDTVRTELVFPLPQNDNGYQEVRLVQQGGDATLSLVGESSTLSYVMQEASSSAESASWKGILRMVPTAPDAEHQAISAAFTLKKFHSSSVDSDTREHDVSTWELAVAPDMSHLEAEDPARAYYADFAPITAKAKVHFHSKNAMSSPTTLEIDASVAMDDVKLSLTATLKSTTPWVMQSMDFTGGENMATLTEERKAELAAAFAANGLDLASQMQARTATPGDLPLPQEEPATGTDMATGTDLNSEGGAQ